MASTPRPTTLNNLTIDNQVDTDGTPTLVCRGRITEDTAGLFKAEVKSHAPGHQYMMADLSEVDFVDSSGLGAVVAAYLSARSAGCELKLVNVHPRVKDLLNISRLATMFGEARPS
ncbi:MAG TPA: STAS domain-containing protein [Vicinamibacterales bacterium]|nr:STAS domain-containing protein [Vicinamibacterales bacterium]